MFKINPFSLSFWTAVIFILVLNIMLFNFLIMRSTAELQVQYIPDDAYYYLTLSRNYSSLGLWTFDSGISLTSGFHLLFAYLLAGIFSLNSDSFVIWGIILSLFFSLVAVGTLWFWGIRQKNILFLMFLAIAISSPNFVYNTISITEWSLTVLLASVYCIWFFNRYQLSIITWLDFLVLFALGILGSVARSDFGLLPFAVAAAVMILSFARMISGRQILLALTGLLGGATGLAIGFLHNYLFTNEFLQSSAKMKAYWAQLLGVSNYYSGSLLIGQIIGFTGLLLLAIMIATAVLPRFLRKEGQSPDHNQYPASTVYGNQDKPIAANNQTLFIMIISAGICILGYTLFYSRNAAIQPWYTANLLLPVLLLIFGISDYVTNSLSIRSQIIFTLFFLLIAGFNLTNLYPINTSNAPWPHQKYMLHAGVYLRENTPGSLVGAWNAGIIGYYEGGHVVNLDGLVNNDIYNFAASNTLPTYLDQENMHYIIDFENMLTDKLRRVRGGYEDADFLESLKPQIIFDQGEYDWHGLTLYQIEKTNRID